MAVSDHPAWADYKAALARLAQAGGRAEEARAQGSPQLAEHEREFREALDTYEAVREWLRQPGIEA